jgi:putative addiction module component (TIGR02574 family)
MLRAEIKNMPVKDRIILMEEIWDTLSYDESKIDSPAWHEEVLDERKKLIKNGNTKFVSINELKFRRK